MRNKRPAGIATAGDERGIGIIEIVVSMFVIALLVLSFIPVLINSNRLSARNTTMATATQIVNAQIESVRGFAAQSRAVPRCQDIVTQTRPPYDPQPVSDPRGGSLLAVWGPITCPSSLSSYPGTVRLSVSVTPSGSTSPLASADTLIWVSTP